MARLSRPRLSEAAVAAPIALAVVAVGALSLAQAGEVALELLPTIAFLAAILVFAHLCAEEGVFAYLAARAAAASGGSASRLLILVVALAAAVTAALTLDSTVVLLTPVIAATVLGMRIDGRAHVYACLRLANSGSLLLPVSNLTNLLAFAATGISFGRFAALMALPWVVAIACEWAALRLWFRRGVGRRRAADPAPAPPVAPPIAVPRFALCVAGGALVGFAALSAAGLSPAWAALAAALLLGVPRLLRGQEPPLRILRELHLGFCLFVLSLGIIVEAAARHGLADLVDSLLPSGDGLLALLGIAAIAAVLSNAVNNIPATLILVPLLAGSPLHLLAMLVGVNIGPNATYVGSLATLLWRKRLPPALRPSAREFHALGAVGTPVVLGATVVALWASWQLIGAGSA